MMDTTYKTVNAFLVAAIPEFRPRYEAERQKRGGHPPQYIAFSALVSVVIPALDFEANPDFLANVFDAFEKMALSSDSEVLHLLQVGFVEDLVKYPKRLAKAWELMGPGARKLTTDTAKARSREMNLPAARGQENSRAKAQAT